MIRELRHEGALLAILVTADHDEDGRNFPTDDALSLQMGYMKFPKGHRIPAHAHALVERAVRKTLEAIIVRSGRVRVDLYAQDGRPAGELELRAGDTILLVGGGHGFTFLEPSALLEIKQGPYLGDRDKAPLGGGEP